MTINTETQATEANYFAMSDDEVMGMMPPTKTVPAEVVETKEEVVDPAAVVTDPVVDPASVVTDPVVEDPTVVKDPVVDPATKTDPAPKEDATTTTTDPVEPKEDEPTAVEEIDYKGSYEKIMAPFKANGKDIQLQSPDEAIKLMQMGANYTKKMQALQPALRVVRMLENNQLLDESKLSYLIDLHQRKPEAIQKLLVDSKFDPLSADVEKAAAYVPGDHRVSETEIQFQTVLDDVESTPTGPALIAEVAQQWDADSRQALFKDPRLLAEINNQKASGLYGVISTELERRKVLGEFQGVPFLAAYEVVGKDLQAKGLLAPKPTEAPRQDPPVTRVVAPAPQVANNDRARAAMPTKVTPTPSKEEFNPLAQSDEEFLKSMQGRL
ncbi:hypothetical protein [Dyella sp. ASV21]|uniref:hypothetical protein n=1 Tax=Dyella sp. ASV21 TaxID=2795114 RepID=UPI0018ED4EBE|nr:hypothetical protein [Dyella sp. ASV21]